MSQHVVPVRIYLVIFATLMALTGLTVWAAFFDLGAMNAAIALTIASCKALLVVLYFMHVRYSSRLTWVFLGAGFFWLMLMIGGTLSDYLTRG